MGARPYAETCAAQKSPNLAAIGSEWQGEAYAFAEYQPMVDTVVVICESGKCPDIKWLYKMWGIRPCRPVHNPQLDIMSKTAMALVEY